VNNSKTSERKTEQFIGLIRNLHQHLINFLHVSLIREFHSQKQFTDKLRDECAQKASSISEGLNSLDGSNSVIDDHPKSFSMVLDFYKVGTRMTERCIKYYILIMSFKCRSTSPN